MVLVVGYVADVGPVSCCRSFGDCCLLGGEEVSPRHYASAYLAAKTPEEQRQAVKGCPPEWRDLVRAHIRLIKEKRDLAHKVG